MNTTSIATIGAFISMGLFANGRMNEILDHWQGGCIEVVTEACEHTELIERLCKAGYDVAGDVSGVFDYEVSEAFGKWYGDRVLQLPSEGHLPDDVECTDKIRQLVFDFYMKVAGVDELKLRAAIFGEG